MIMMQIENAKAVQTHHQNIDMMIKTKVQDHLQVLHIRHQREIEIITETENVQNLKEAVVVIAIDAIKAVITTYRRLCIHGTEIVIEIDIDITQIQKNHRHRLPHLQKKMIIICIERSQVHGKGHGQEIQTMVQLTTTIPQVALT